MKSSLKCFPCLLLFLISFLFSISVNAQEKIRIHLKDKSGVQFDPYTYFDSSAIERKTNAGIAIDDISDYPLNSKYLETIAQHVEDITGQSRWFNMVFCVATEEQIESLLLYDFIDSIEKTGDLVFDLCEEQDPEILDYSKSIKIGQTSIHKANFFTENQVDGKGIRIAIFDVGFDHIDEIPQLKHLFDNNQIIDTWDFIRNKPMDFKKGGDHGAMVLSCIAGIDNEIPMGMAPGAQFYLARTERNLTEFKSEEENWLMAAEWADKNGVHVINSSLGYTAKRYYQRDLNGKIAFVSRAASKAAAKGMLVVNSAGNEGADAWITIGAPADADSVLTVGGINSGTGFHSNFSSFGPTADKRLKPNVCSFGNAMVVNDGHESLSEAFGTSFSSPLIAGFAACAWQINPKRSNMEIFDMIQKSGHLYPYFDYAHGYGIPQASYFYGGFGDLTQETFKIKESGDLIYVSINPDFMPSDTTSSSLELNLAVMKHTGNIFQRSDEELVEYYANLTEDFLYFHFENEQGYLRNYSMIRVKEKEGASIYIGDHAGETLRIFYRGYMLERKL